MFSLSSWRQVPRLIISTNRLSATKPALEANKKYVDNGPLRDLSGYPL